MDTEELKKQQAEAEDILEHASRSQITPMEVKGANPSALDQIWGQRHDQRNKLFIFAIKLAEDSIFFLFAIIFLSMLTNILFGKDHELFSGYTLQILSVGVIGQVISIIAIIAKSIWDDKPYSTMLDKDHSMKHHES